MSRSEPKPPRVLTRVEALTALWEHTIRDVIHCGLDPDDALEICAVIRSRVEALRAEGDVDAARH